VTRCVATSGSLGPIKRYVVSATASFTPCRALSMPACDVRPACEAAQHDHQHRVDVINAMTSSAAATARDARCSHRSVARTFFSDNHRDGVDALRALLHHETLVAIATAAGVVQPLR
jgi:hypothetical protein